MRPITAHSPWTDGKLETQNQHIALYWRNFLNDSRNNWSSLIRMFAFAHNTSVNYTVGKTPKEIVFGTKPQISMTSKLALYRKKHKLCCSEFSKDLPSHSHSLKNQLLDNFSDYNFHKRPLNENAISKETILPLSKDVEKKLDRMPTEVDLNWAIT